MINSKYVYISLGIIFLISFGVSFFLPTGEVFKGIITIPGVLALIGALYQIFRDQANFDRQSYLVSQQQLFNLGASSHMANVAFDKHVEFCEKYMKEVHIVIQTLFSKGPTTEVLQNLQNFHEIKRQYSAWLPQDITLKLKSFEDAINKIGSLSHLVDAAKQNDHESTMKSFDEMYDILKKLLNLEKQQNLDTDFAVEQVKQKVRSILGIEELTQIRKLLINESITFLNKKA
ncbi:hypothetical protein H8E88_02720 [candidate division KSB1 bacterium]|nr:hypothetical protein [candidate division KSB1 bacterium]